jgi:acyl phosphate:glycerol-3-phosphate acyltransferase
MMLFSKTLHVLALGLWFGTVVFFTLSGYLIFEEFKKGVAKAEHAQTWPEWFVLPDDTPDTANTNLPELLTKERASRAFGVAVAPLFPWFYGIQLVCAFLAYGTALSWQKWRETDNVQRWRTWLLLLAVIVTLAGWWLEGKVSDLRGPRNTKTDLVLKTKAPTAAQVAAAEQARAEFAQWHGYSLMQNFATLILVTMVMALAAQLPASPLGSAPSTPEERNAVSDRQTPAPV